MKRFFSVKDYLQTPKTNTHLFTANTVRRVCSFSRKSSPAKSVENCQDRPRSFIRDPWEVLKMVNLIDLVKGFPKSICSQNSTSIQSRTSSSKLRSQVSEITRQDHIPSHGCFASNVVRACVASRDCWLRRRRAELLGNKVNFLSSLSSFLPKTV